MLVVGNWNLGRNRFTEQWSVETMSLPETAGGKPRFQDRLPHHQICDASSAAGPEPIQWFFWIGFAGDDNQSLDVGISQF